MTEEVKTTETLEEKPSNGKKLSDEQMLIANTLMKQFKKFRRLGGDITKNEAMWCSRALEKTALGEKNFHQWMPFAEAVRAIVVNPELAK